MSWVVLFFRGKKKVLKFLTYSLYPSFFGVLFWMLNICCCIFCFSVKPFIILNTDCHLNHVTHWYLRVTSFGPSRGKVCTFSLHTYIWHVSSSSQTSVSYFDFYVFNVGPYVLELQCWKWSYRSSSSSLSFYSWERIRTWQRSLVWFMRSHHSLASCFPNPVFFPWSTLSELHLFNDVSILVGGQNRKSCMLQCKVTEPEGILVLSQEEGKAS